MITCKDLLWDQRISNEPIYKRNTFPNQPPILFTQRPMNTNQYYTDDNIDRNNNWLITDDITNQGLYNYMKDYDNSFENNKNYNKIGVWKNQFNSNSNSNINPSLYGVKYDINKESKLKSINYQNSKDCINSTVSNNLKNLNKTAMKQIYNNSFVICNVYPNHTNKWFNNQTKMKLLTKEPVTFTNISQKTRLNCEKCSH